MKKAKNFIPYIIIGIVVIFGYSRCPSYNKNDYEYKRYNEIIDSLKLHILKQNSIFENERKYYTNKIDSLTKVKSKTHIKYETIFKDFSDITIVSNDSITNYISRKIHNK